jgi:hypothetical protein
LQRLTAAANITAAKIIARWIIPAAIIYIRRRIFCLFHFCFFVIFAHELHLPSFIFFPSLSLRETTIFFQLENRYALSTHGIKIFILFLKVKECEKFDSLHNQIKKGQDTKPIPSIAG